ncbi:uncharacterized protein LOC121588656 isoform X1 [Anopheles merus]|uniref:uncharacterized protein LOC121588656 isoform X1 n=1 Tax=Anopheles merus TaxID=30066 RepID=UPI001BE49682|nr:uncharacterized protein LOC121588656 isoform X1 [Anopheles merus]XP_041762780.1 uncharacterized protein LOC121588656 isoform X1 [Anopheles merus]XP_041762781.1 uncharacterized protein LOC121588656 isoform X1 [Anopheles merus]XP_041762782.1 uncharacterized protein LOC121588656 isoform X1 [Anopheles merus]
MIPHRTVRLHRLQRAGSVWNGQRSVTKFGGAVLAVVLLCAATVIGRAEGYNASAGSKPEDMPSSAEGEQLMPQALSLTTLLSEDPTAAALQHQPGQTDASLQPLAEHGPSAPSSSPPDGRRRRRLGRKRKRRPLQDDYWPPAAPEDNDTESNVFSSPTAAAAGTRGSERKRLPARWEEAGQQQKVPPSSFRQGVRTNGNWNHHQQQQQRAGDWMHNPYTDAVNVEQPAAAMAAIPARRLPGGQSTAAASAGGNLPPMDANRSRRIAGGRPTEQPPTNGKAYRKPYSQARRTEEEHGDGGGSGETAGKLPASAADLKALLKQSDGLSLSEILQQRNISLQDLIKGKQMALAALTQSPLEATTTTMPSTAGETDPASTLSPTLSSVRFRVYDDDGVTGRPSQPGGETTTGAIMTSPTTSTVLPAPASDMLTTSGFNGHPLEDDESSNAVGDDNNGQNGGGGVGNIFPTVEIKQLALNPVLPVHKEEQQRVRPIKGVASRIRPDLSNTHIRTEPGLSTPSTSGLTSPSLLLLTPTTREKWTPSAALVGQRAKQQTIGSKQRHHGYGTTLPASFSSSGSADRLTVTTVEPPTAKKLVAPKLSSIEATSILPEAEAMVELSPDRPLQQHLLRVPKLKPRIAIKPKLTNVVPPTLPAEPNGGTLVSSPSSPPPDKRPPSTKDPLDLSDVELEDDSTGDRGTVATTDPPTGKRQPPTRQHRLHDDLEDEGEEEPRLNIIEKFTSFADSSAGVRPHAAAQDERDSEQEAAVADLIGRISEHTQRSFTDSLEELYRDVTESNPSLFNDLSPITSADERRELLELMEDRRIGSRLAKVLSQRNMTLDQLLEHRRRGSSQLHLAEIANGKVKPIDDKIDIVTAFEHFPRFNIGNLRSIRPDDIKHDSQGFSYFTSIINIRPSDEGYSKEGRALQQDRHRSRAAGSNHQHHHRSESHFLVKGGSKDRLLVPSRMSAAMEHAHGSNGEQQRGDAGTGDDRMDVDGDLLDLELSGHGFQHHRGSVTIERPSMPVGVRSAIVASSAIVGVSLLIFVAIFVACRVRQRRRQKLNYTEHFHMAKGRLPILHGGVEQEQQQQQQARNSCTPAGSGRSSSLGEQQVVYTTHRALAERSGATGGAGTTSTAAAAGRQRTMMDPNSVEIQDYLWDRKPFQ